MCASWQSFLVDGGVTTVDKTLSPTSLLPKPEADALLAILAPRPLYSVSLDDPLKDGA
ncbi:MAG: hypothetical protein U0787_12045 [Polyangia bacterium]